MMSTQPHVPDDKPYVQILSFDNKQRCFCYLEEFDLSHYQRAEEASRWSRKDLLMPTRMVTA
jgi:hypothetical protein